MRKNKDLTGQKFWKLTAIKISDSGAYKKTKWECVCDCGGTIVVRTDSLFSGNTKSCGCLVGVSNIKHGLSTDKQYMIWKSMIHRCYSKNSPHYINYGGRGITVCDRWLESFNNFLNDMGNRPTNKHSIDRIDNSKGYSVENCRWATHTEQIRNRRNTLMINFNGATKSLPEWCDSLNLNYKMIVARIKLGWSNEEAFSTKKIIGRESWRK